MARLSLPHEALSVSFSFLGHAAKIRAQVELLVLTKTNI